MKNTTLSLNDQIATVIIATPMHEVIHELMDWSSDSSADACADEMYNILNRAGKVAVIEYAQAICHVQENGDPVAYDELYNCRELRAGSPVSAAAQKIESEMRGAAGVICDFNRGKLAVLLERLTRRIAKRGDENCIERHKRLCEIFADCDKIKTLSFDFELFVGRLVAAEFIPSELGSQIFATIARNDGEDFDLWDDEIDMRYYNCIRLAEGKEQRTMPDDDDARFYICADCGYSESVEMSNGVCPVCNT